MAEPIMTALDPSKLMKLSRTSKPKVRTGCQTCKRRKVKCDELKPRCSRCDKAGIECEGYGIFINIRSKPLRTAPAAEQVPFLSDTFIFYRGINSLSELSEIESASYDFVRHRTVSELSSLQCVHFWTSSVLAGCHSDPAIMHGLLALGAAHRSYTSTRASQSYENKDPFSRVAYTHYGKAIKHLQTRTSINDEENYRIVLIVCLILLSFDLLEARYAAAILHLHHGRRLLKQRHCLENRTQESGALYLPSEAQTVDEELVYNFGQIDLQGIYFGGGKPQLTFVDDPAKFDPMDYTIPDSFTSLDDAGRYVMILINECWRLTGVVPDHRKFNPANAEVVNHQHRLLASLKRWEQSYDKMSIPTASPDLAEDSDARKGAILQIYHATATVRVSVCLSYPDEMVYDSLLSYQTRVVSLASTLFPNLPAFNLNTAIIQPVYSVAIHCRHPVLRRKAVELLRVSRREGLWDSRLVVILAEGVIRHEEEHARYEYNEETAPFDDFHLAKLIPLESRIAETWMFFTDEDQHTLRSIHKRPRWADESNMLPADSTVDNNGIAWEVIEELTPLTETP